MTQLINAFPVLHQPSTAQSLQKPFDLDDSRPDPIEPLEIFSLIRHINDPEHPHSLETLNVVQPELISMENHLVTVRFTPTIPHCSMATLIGLCIRVRLLRSLPSWIKIDIRVTEGTHQSEHAGNFFFQAFILQVNKQLNDKERVAAALENTHLLEIVNQVSLLFAN